MEKNSEDFMLKLATAGRQYVWTVDFGQFC